VKRTTVDQLVVVDRPRHGDHLHVVGEEPADQMLGVEGLDALTAHPAGHDRHVGEVGVGGHRGHGGPEITVELGLQMSVEQLGGCLLGAGR
jgi:hypothetical protein